MGLRDDDGFDQSGADDGVWMSSRDKGDGALVDLQEHSLRQCGEGDGLLVLQVKVKILECHVDSQDVLDVVHWFPLQRTHGGVIHCQHRYAWPPAYCSGQLRLAQVLAESAVLWVLPHHFIYVNTHHTTLHHRH